ncbi:MAG: DUF4173 domain-containing protein [Flavobacteriales bacterium]|nr:DUF4173 domain-containing protein [Flavobacteriales bacterium]
MSHTHRSFLTCLAFATLFTALFHGTGIGLNLLLFEAVVLVALFALGRVPAQRHVLLPVAATLLTAVMVVLYGSVLALVVNVVSVVFTVGVLLAPELEALHHAAALAMAHLFAAQRALLRTLPVARASGNGFRLTPRGVLSVTLVPLIVLLFVILYSASNPYFAELAVRSYAWLEVMDASLPLLFAAGLALSAFLFLLTRHQRFMRWATSRTDALLPRTVDQQEAHQRVLRSEAMTGLLLLACLNALLLLLNALDIWHVWFHFSFTGQYLKAFVHQGTWLLILSIVLGALIVLYFFRGDLNFHSGNRTMKYLSYLWLLQNVVLVVSVALRNYWYIHHYALAYKRIGVAFFLLATLVGLVLIVLKVYHRRSHHFLIRWNMVSVYTIAVVMTLVDWDVLIARYNMAQRERAFVELDFLATLEDKALPALLVSAPELERLDAHDQRVTGLSSSEHRALYMHPVRFAYLTRQREQRFLQTYPERSWREWVLADARAYRALRSPKP